MVPKVGTMNKIHDTIASYQKRIGSYDKQLWEQSVEQKVYKSISHVPRRTGRMKTEFIDVDLVRGSTFTKAKPQVPWTRITQRAVLRVVFFPFYYRWWIQQTSASFWLAMLVLYTSQLLTMVIYISNAGEYLKTDSVTLSEVSFPALLMLILGLMHSQTVLAHFSHKPNNRDGLKSSRDSRKNCRKRSTKVADHKNAFDGSRKGSFGYKTEKKCERYKRRDFSKSRDKPDSKWETGTHADADSNTGSDDEKTSVHMRLSHSQSSSSSSKCDRVPNSVSRAQSISNNCSAGFSSCSKKTGERMAINKNIESFNRTCVVLGNRIYSRKLDDDDVIDGCHQLRSQSQIPPALSTSAQEADLKTNKVSQDLKVAFSLNENTVLRKSRSLDDLHSSCDLSDVIKCDQTKNGTTAFSVLCHNSPNRQFPNISCSQSHNSRQHSYSVSSKKNPFTPQPWKVGYTTHWSQGNSDEDSSTSPKAKNSELSMFNDGLITEGLRQRRVQSKRWKKSDDPINLSALSFEAPSIKESPPPSSSEGETMQTPDYRKPMISSEEWDDRMHSDIVTSSFETSSCTSETEMSTMQSKSQVEDLHSPGWNLNNLNVINLLQPPSNSSTGHSSHIPPPDKVSCVIWEGNECQKVDLTALHISWVIIDKVDQIPDSSDYIYIGIFFSLVMGLMPPLFRIYNCKEFFTVLSTDGFLAALLGIGNSGWKINLIMLNAVLQRLCLSVLFFFLLSVADRTFKQRLLYAKYFSYLTSSRGARKFDLPHFRLNKVRNIKTWLSLRSYLKKRGPQRSVDVIVSASFLLTIISVTLMCLQLLKDSDTYLDYLCNWELLAWSLALGVYILRFMTLGLKINQKYRNLSVLITEQINLYLQMEQKPHKKEKLMLANSVLKLAEDLLKELESPFKISGLSANPFLYNLTKVVVLSAFSGVLSELLGFKLKLYKIKFKT